MTYLATIGSSHPSARGFYPIGEPAPTHEAELIAALRRGDEAAFEQLVERYQGAMLRIALIYVSSRAVAEEVVQETWLNFLQSLGRFEGRCALKTWLFRILVNRARSHGVRESRIVPFAALRLLDSDADDVLFDPAQLGGSHGAGGLALTDADALPEERALARETRACIERAIDALPATQRTVITLRDIEGWSAAEVCDFLNVSEVNQRVLLHRARAHVRSTLERYLDGA